MCGLPPHFFTPIHTLLHTSPQPPHSPHTLFHTSPTLFSTPPSRLTTSLTPPLISSTPKHTSPLFLHSFHIFPLLDPTPHTTKNFPISLQSIHLYTPHVLYIPQLLLPCLPYHLPHTKISHFAHLLPNQSGNLQTPC